VQKNDSNDNHDYYYILSDNRWRFNFSIHVDDDFKNITEKTRENIDYISIVQSEMKYGDK